MSPIDILPTAVSIASLAALFLIKIWGVGMTHPLADTQPVA
jgi:hypothetical protein